MHSDISRVLDRYYGRDAVATERLIRDAFDVTVSAQILVGWAKLFSVYRLFTCSRILESISCREGGSEENRPLIRLNSSLYN